MKLYRAKIESIARDLIEQLASNGDIEVTNRSEAEADIQSVLKEYLRLEREITDEAKDAIAARQLSFSQFGKVKRLIAEQKGVGLGDESVDWMATQIVETFMQSAFVEEVFASDTELRHKMRDILRKHMLVDEEIDAEVRQRIRNLEEGTNTWDIEYAKAMEQIRRKRGIEKE